jgi:branched-chain amino acid transport system ATP-binding protein
LIGKHAGTVQFDGNDVTHTAAHKLIPMGMAQVPEGRRIFQELTVYENLQLGFFTVREKALFAQRLEEMYGRFPILKERAKQVAGTLSGGEQQMLAMSRALMSGPKLLLLDEPSMGLSPLYVQTIFDMIQTVNKTGTTVLLVEQNAKKALSIADRAYVLEIGRVTRTGKGSELLEDEAVRAAYLGG